MNSQSGIKSKPAMLTSMNGGSIEMSATGLEVFDTTVQKTMIWLKDLMEELHLQDALV
jgi:hypothetical protein